MCYCDYYKKLRWFRFKRPVRNIINLYVFNIIGLLVYKLYYYILDHFDIKNRALVLVNFAIVFLASCFILVDNNKNIAITHLF